MEPYSLFSPGKMCPFPPMKTCVTLPILMLFDLAQNTMDPQSTTDTCAVDFYFNECYVCASTLLPLLRTSFPSVTFAIYDKRYNAEYYFHRPEER